MELLMKQIKAMLHKKTDISVIMPFYNSEQYILRALDSIVFHSDISYEIICVNDGSTDNSAEIVRQYMGEHPRVRLVNLKENKGLYLARLTGIRKATGKYIGFLDSDDYVSPYYFENLYISANQDNADIAVGEVICVNTEGESYIQTRCKIFPYLNDDDPCLKDNLNLQSNSSGNGVYSLYWRQRGRCYHWHVIWNKVYKYSMFKKCLKILSRQKSHLVMLEDFIFSSVVLSNVRGYVQVEKAFYYYCENPSSSIGRKTFYSVKKNIEDMQKAFDFVEVFLKRSFADSYLNDFMEWKARYGRYWKRNVNNMNLSLEEIQDLELLLYILFGNDILPVTKEDEYYYEKAEIL